MWEPLQSLQLWWELQFFKPQTIEELAKKCQTPEDLCTWGFRHLKYIGDKNKHGVNEFWQTAQETFDSKTGDCEDFSILYYTALRINGYDPKILCVFSPTQGGHAVCAVKEDKDKWVHVSNWGYRPTKAKDLKGVAKHVYPDMYGFYEANTEGQRLIKGKPYGKKRR